MEISSTRKKKRIINRESTKVDYINSLQFYTQPPTETISLQEFEEYAIERLKVLKAIETTGIKHMKGSEEYEEALNKELRKTVFRDIIKGDVTEKALRIDHLSHFILRLAYCKSEDLRRWFLQQELDFFRYRFDRLKTKPDAVSTFLSANNLNYKPMSTEEKEEMRGDLVAAAGGRILLETTDYYKVPFVEALDLVKGRKVYLSQGYAYVPQRDFISIIISVYRAHLSQSLAVTSRALPHLEEDTRLLFILGGLSRRYLGQDYSAAKRPAGQITADMIDTLSKKSFPLCMQQLHRELRQSHHLKHWGRMQYGLFLKGTGLTLDEALKFWRGEFTKTMDTDKFEKQYAYNVRHNYGKEGKRTDYTPYTCAKIITSNSPAQGDHHGCPFRHTDTELLRQQLKSTGISKENLDTMVRYTKGGHFQLACARYFEVTHSLPEETNFSLQHPNQYFEESQRYLKGTKAIPTVKTPSRVVKTYPSQNTPAQNTPSQNTLSQNTPSSMSHSQASAVDNLDMSGIDEMMDDDFDEDNAQTAADV